MSTLEGKFIILGVSASIAAYKACELASMLIKAGAQVQVLMTQDATNFVHPLTFESLIHTKCIIDTFDRNFEYKIGHISLAERADCFVLAPATANIIAKCANGIADDMLTTTFLACTCPKILAPAMNTRMYENPITQDNIKKCASYGMTIIEAESGHLACGSNGKGKLAKVETIFSYIEYAVSKKDFVAKNILVTAGPTQEALDPVRFLTNHSSGKMGYAIAYAAALRGAKVTLVSGKVSLSPPPFVNTINVISAKDMAKTVKESFSTQDIIIKAAAVADYRPVHVSEQKIKKSQGNYSIELERTEDILAFLGQHKKEGQFLCGFSMETENLIENSLSKLKKKNLDMIVANNLFTQGAGFEKDTNVVTIITEKEQEQLPIMTKVEVANALLDKIWNIVK